MMLISNWSCLHLIINGIHMIRPWDKLHEIGTCDLPQRVIRGLRQALFKSAEPYLSNLTMQSWRTGKTCSFWTGEDAYSTYRLSREHVLSRSHGALNWPSINGTVCEFSFVLSAHILEKTYPTLRLPFECLHMKGAQMFPKYFVYAFTSTPTNK